jgi:phosphoglycerate kinase
MAVKSIKDLAIAGKRVFFRFDFNVPLDDRGAIKDATRIERVLPTLRYAMAQRARCILASHLGRPKGEVRPHMSLRPVAAELGRLLDREVGFVSDCIGPEVEEAVARLQDGELLLLENLRFHPGETKNEEEFARLLAKVADVYVNDAFGTAHRAHASTVGITAHVQEKAAGLLLKDELDSLHKALDNPLRPVVAVFGGAKVSDKVGVLRNLVDKMDAIIIGGGMANTFLKAEGLAVGASKVEDESVGAAEEILGAARQRNTALLLPKDVVTAERIDEAARTTVVPAESIPENSMALDIGPKSAEAFGEQIDRAGTIVWNGPMGVFEMAPFADGTRFMAERIANADGFSVVGGGDTVRAVSQFGVSDRISYISTGGGAFMEFMEGRQLPGVAALEQ